MKNFLYRLWFTKDDTVDSSQLVLLSLYALYIVGFVQASRGQWTITADLLQSLLWVMGLASIQAAPQWLVFSWIQSRLLLAQTATSAATGQTVSSPQPVSFIDSGQVSFPPSAEEEPD